MVKNAQIEVRLKDAVDLLRRLGYATATYMKNDRIKLKMQHLGGILRTLADDQMEQRLPKLTREERYWMKCVREDKSDFIVVTRRRPHKLNVPDDFE